MHERINARGAGRSNELDAHPAHTEHDHRRNEPGDDRAASVGQTVSSTGSSEGARMSADRCQD